MGIFCNLYQKLNFKQILQKRVTNDQYMYESSSISLVIREIKKKTILRYDKLSTRMREIKISGSSKHIIGKDIEKKNQTLIMESKLL